LDGFSVANRDEVLFTNVSVVSNDGDVGGKVEVDWQRDEFIKGKKILSFNIRHMKDEDDCMFLRAVNERGLQFVQVRRLMNEIVEFVLGSRVLDVMHDRLQHFPTEST
jgi:hypothetical protein